MNWISSVLRLSPLASDNTLSIIETVFHLLESVGS